MHIISLKALRSFWATHPDAEQPLRKWHGVVAKTDFTSFNHLRENFSSADFTSLFLRKMTGQIDNDEFVSSLKISD